MTPDFFRGCLFLQTNVCYVMPARFVTRLSGFFLVKFQNFSPKKQRDEHKSSTLIPIENQNTKNELKTPNNSRRTKIQKRNQNYFTRKTK
jgi:hypothetical protein